MKNYEYQILRYIPDRVNAEFVNVGLVIYGRDDKYLKSQFINRSTRLSSFFQGTNIRYVMQSIRHLEKQFSSISHNLKEDIEFSRPNSVEEITSNLLTKDDTSLVFSVPNKAIDLSLDIAFDNLKKQLLFRYDIHYDHLDALRDPDVWTKVYKKYFIKVGIKDKLVSHTVKTKYDKIEFQHAWKNDIWHCYQPITFALSREDNVKNKVYRWLGKIQELQTSSESIRIELLTVMPKKPALRNFILNQLKNQKVGNSTFKIVEEKEAENFAQQLKLDFEKHES